MSGSVLDALKLEIISDIDVFEQLAEEWTSLCARSATRTVFLEWEWHFTWWQVFAQRKDQLYIMTWRRNGQLLGLLPLYIRHSSIPVGSSLHFIGTGGPCEDEVATEYSDLLVDADEQQAISAQAATHLYSFEHWQRIELVCLLSDSLLFCALRRNELKPMWIRSTGQRYRVSLEKDEDTWLSLMDSSRVKRIKRSQRAMLREGGMTVQSPTSISDFDRAFQDLSELNHERQVHKQRKGVFTSLRFRDFHHRLCVRLVDKGMARIISHYVGMRLIAVLYCFYDDQTCYYYQSGFATRNANRLMPLTLAHLSEMQRSRDAGLRYYDFMRGEPPCYKDELACEITQLVNVSVYRTKAHFRVTQGYRRARSAVATVLRRFASS